MNWTKLSVAALLTAASIISSATTYADPVPTPDEVVAVMAALTDPSRPTASKSDVVTPGLAPEEAEPVDDHLNSLNEGGYIPFNFVVTDIHPEGNAAGATVAAPNTYPHRSLLPVPIVLVDQSGHWSITHDAAVVFLNQMWSNCHRRRGGFAL